MIKVQTDASLQQGLRGGGGHRTLLTFQRSLFSKLPLSSVRGTLRLTTGLILFAYITMHLANHALGLISLDVAEAGLRVAVVVWHSWTGTVLLYGAFVIHFLHALWAVYERRTFRLPPAELLRIILGFWLPVALIGHVASTRIAYELFENSPTYSHIIANLWASGSRGWQMGLLAPGWIHGCLGLHFAFNRRLIYIRLKYVLLAVALLLPVLSALGYVMMGRELVANAAVAQAAIDYLSPTHAPERMAIQQWRDELLAIYFVIVAATFGARKIRNILEHSRRHLVSISYPGRSVRVPRGWTVLEASRAFHIPHASMCGGRARCSTCRVRILEGAEVCPPPKANEIATLKRIGASSDIRLACQLRPRGHISVLPLVLGEHAYVGSRTVQYSDNRDLVVLYCDFLNRAVLSKNQLPQDALYMQSTYLTEVCNAIRDVNGVLISVEPDSVCALFGLHYGGKQAAKLGLQAAAAIEKTMTDLNERLGQAWPNKIDFAVTMHAGCALIREIGSTTTPLVMAIGEAIDAANELRKTAAQSAVGGKPFTVSEAVYTTADLDPGIADKIVLRSTALGVSLAVFQSTSVHVPPAYVRAHTRRERVSALRRLWSG
jgi:adenylate cyclase